MREDISLLWCDNPITFLQINLGRLNNRSQELCSFSLVVTLELKKKKKKKWNKLWKEEQKLAVDGKEILWALKTGFKIGTLEVREFKGQLLMGLKGLGLGAA